MYHSQISQRLEAAIFVSRMVGSLCNLTGVSATMLPRRLSNFKAMWLFNNQSRGFDTSRDLILSPTWWWVFIMRHSRLLFLIDYLRAEIIQRKLKIPHPKSIYYTDETPTDDIPGLMHDDVKTWSKFSHYWPFVREIHRWTSKCGALVSDGFSVVSLNKLLNDLSRCRWFVLLPIWR